MWLWCIYCTCIQPFSIACTGHLRVDFSSFLFLFLSLVQISTLRGTQNPFFNYLPFQLNLLNRLIHNPNIQNTPEYDIHTLVLPFVHKIKKKLENQDYEIKTFSFPHEPKLRFYFYALSLSLKNILYYKNHCW